MVQNHEMGDRSAFKLYQLIGSRIYFQTFKILFILNFDNPLLSSPQMFLFGVE
jgi:hypothetical protein